MNDAGSHGSLSETIGQIPTQTSVAASSPTSTYGQGVSFTATVAPNSGSISPTGTVTFYDETTPLGNVPLSPADGVATATLASSSLMAGSHWVTATYSGDANSSTSSSVAPVPLAVAEAMTSVTLASSAAQSAVGQVVTLTASIGSAATGETGTIQFDDNGSLLGAGTVSNNEATFQTSSLTPGNHPITAVYEGDDNFVGTSSTNTVNQAILAVAGPAMSTTTSVVVSPPAPTYGAERHAHQHRGPDVRDDGPRRNRDVQRQRHDARLVHADHHGRRDHGEHARYDAAGGLRLRHRLLRR